MSIANVGGIAGFATGAKLCTNNSDITVSTNGKNVGGIVGRCAAGNGATLDDNVNEGTIQAYENVGGIFGAVTLYYNGVTASLSNCQNNKTISGTGNNVGGIVGKQIRTGSGYSSTNSTLTISNCINTAKITGNSYIAGIIGYGVSTKKDENIWMTNNNFGSVFGNNSGDKYGHLE